MFFKWDYFLYNGKVQSQDFLEWNDVAVVKQ